MLFQTSPRTNSFQIIKSIKFNSRSYWPLHTLPSKSIPSYISRPPSKETINIHSNSDEKWSQKKQHFTLFKKKILQKCRHQLRDLWDNFFKIIHFFLTALSRHETMYIISLFFALWLKMKNSTEKLKQKT